MPWIETETETEGIEPTAILDFWIGPDDITPEGWSEKQKLWYTSSSEIDDKIRQRFGKTLTAAEAGELQNWNNSLKGQLALIVLYDQFSRNLFRGTPDVYRNDAAAMQVADNIINNGQLDSLNVPAHILVFHAWHHAEDRRRQQKVVELGQRLLDNSSDAWRPSIEANFTYMKNHSHIIARYGRFPHRNEILGRTSTPEELAFLDKDKRTYGQ